MNKNNSIAKAMRLLQSRSGARPAMADGGLPSLPTLQYRGPDGKLADVATEDELGRLYDSSGNLIGHNSKFENERYGAWDSPEGQSTLGWLGTKAYDIGQGAYSGIANLASAVSPIGTSEQGNMAFQVPPMIPAVGEAFGRLVGTPEHPGTMYSLTGVPELDKPVLDDTNTAVMSMFGGNAFNPLAVAPKGSVGMFAGRAAKTADHAALARAEEMASQGVPREQIWNDTGWFKGADDKWRFEIDDSGSSFRGKDTLRHPRLYDAYEDLSDTKILRSGRQDEGGYMRGFGAMPDRVLIGDGSADPRSIALHEFQHGVQRREDFSGGETPLGLMKEASRIKDTPEARAVFGDERVDRANLIRDNADAAMDIYRRSAGETEARAVQSRMDLTPEERQARPPWLDYDVPEADQIVKFLSDNKPSLMGSAIAGAEEAAAPIRAYHWTAEPSISEANKFQPFSHFGTAEQAANRYQYKLDNDMLPWHPSGEDHGLTMPVDLDIKNPLILDHDSLMHDPVMMAYSIERAIGAQPGEMSGYAAKQVLDHLEDGDIYSLANNWYEIDGSVPEMKAHILATLSGKDGVSTLSRGLKELSDGPEPMAFPQQAYDALSDRVLAHGYDGIAYPNSVEGPGLSYVNIKPNTVRSATTGETLFSDTGKPNILGSALATAGNQSPQVQAALKVARELDSHGFYSPSLEASKVIPQEVGTVGQMKSMLLKNGAKPKELEALSFDEAFPDPNAKVNRQDIEDFLRGNRVALGRQTNADSVYSIRDEYGDEHGSFVSEDAARNAMRGMTGRDYRVEREPVSRFESYSTPGGIPGSYRETIATLPLDRRAIENQVRGQFKDGTDQATINAVVDDIIAGGRSGGALDANTYTSSHWPGITNPLLHYRTKDFPGVEGSKTRVLDEMQSDWAQRARDAGTRNSAQLEALEGQTNVAWNNQMVARDKIASVFAEPGYKYLVPDHVRENPTEAANWVLRDPNGSPDVAARLQPLYDEFQKARNEHLDLQSKLQSAKKGVPNAPFISNTSDWTDLGLKHALLDAARDPAVDRLAWAPGKVQADRYGLEKHVKSVGSNPVEGYGPGGRQVVLHGPTGVVASGYVDGNGVIQKGYDAFRGGEGKHLSEFIGRDISDKVFSKPDAHVLEGQDLKMGGEGMKGYYDKIIPQRLQKLLKGIDPDVAIGDLQEIPIGAPRTISQMLERDGLPVNADNIAKYGPAYEAEKARGYAAAEYPSISLTPRLRQKLLDEGLSLFADQKPSIMGSALATAGDLPMDHASRMARAREMGFDVDTTWYHGTNKDFDEFKVGPDSRGIFLTKDPEQASYYAGMNWNPDTPMVYPVHVRGDVSPSYDDAFGVVTNPANIRSVNAAFDPARAGENGLLLSDTGKPSILGSAMAGAQKEALQTLKNNGGNVARAKAEVATFYKADDPYRSALESALDEISETTNPTKPYRAYHGTSTPWDGEFDPAQSRATNHSQPRPYFANLPDEASGYALDRAQTLSGKSAEGIAPGTPSVIPADINISNPFNPGLNGVDGGYNYIDAKTYKKIVGKKPDRSDRTGYDVLRALYQQEAHKLLTPEQRALEGAPYNSATPDAPSYYGHIYDKAIAPQVWEGVYDRLEKAGYDGLVEPRVPTDYADAPHYTKIIPFKKGTVKSPYTGETLFSDTGKPNILGSAIATAGEQSGPKLRAYHAMGGDLEGGTFDLGRAGSGANAGLKEDAVFFSNNPDTADTYLPAYYRRGGDGEPEVVRDYAPGSNILPVDIDQTNFDVWDMGGAGYRPGQMSSILADAKESGAPGVILENYRDPGVSGVGAGKKQSTIAVFQRGTVTSPLTGEVLFSDTGKPSVLGSVAATAGETPTAQGIKPFARSGNEGLSYLLNPPAKNASILGTETGRVPKNGIGVLKSANAPEGYESSRVVMAKDGKIVGAMQVTKTPDGKPTVANTYVDPEYRRQGVATELNDHAKKLYGDMDRSPDASEQGAAFRSSLRGEGSSGPVIKPFAKNEKHDG